ncbi:MAG: hypothetical protein QM796_01595 [Chthoniobacteraceae bacterium]
MAPPESTVRSSSFNPQGPALRLEGITLSFGGVKAVSEIDLVVQPGEIRAIIGPNGAGKVRSST